METHFYNINKKKIVVLQTINFQAIGEFQHGKYIIHGFYLWLCNLEAINSHISIDNVNVT